MVKEVMGLYFYMVESLGCYGILLKSGGAGAP